MYGRIQCSLIAGLYGKEWGTHAVTFLTHFDLKKQGFTKLFAGSDQMLQDPGITRVKVNYVLVLN
jgi:hypothetical protein